MISRARAVAEAYQMNVREACQSLTPIGINATIVTGADGATFDVDCNDDLSATPVAGDHLSFRALGSQRYLLLGLISGLKDDTAVGYRGFRWNGNNVKNNFEDSFDVDAVAQAFWNVEAVRSGIEAFAWDCIPAFGPNDLIQIGLYNTTGSDVDIQLMAYCMPVPNRYKAPVGVAKGK